MAYSKDVFLKEICQVRYDPRSIEAKRRKQWLKKKIYEPDMKRAKRPFYNLMMFPYPSAEGLHVGNMYAFVGADIYGRMKRMQGYDVFEPIGLDGFGIHSENYALSIGKHPADQAKISEKRFYRQLQMIGNGFSWNEHLETYDPDYYRWTQWIFVQMFKRGLAYRKKAAVNWCPSCKTVLADEQVIAGACERCSTTVVKKELEQWFFKITDYAERLLKNLEKIDWSEKIKVAQRNWIGRSEGAEIEFKIKNSEFRIQVFTTRPDTLFGATYMVLGPEHELIAKIKNQIANIKEVEGYIHTAVHKSDEERIAGGREKTGVELKGVTAVNPANDEEIPVWVADYVLGDVGTGAIMAVPAHDQRDYEFAKRFGLSIKQVIAPYFLIIDGKDAVRRDAPTVRRRTAYAIVKHYQEDKYLCLDWENFGWHSGIIGGINNGESPVEAALREIREETGYQNIEFIRYVGGEVHNHYYAAHKGENRYAVGYGMLFRLADEKCEVVAAEHAKNHRAVWIESKRMKEWLNLSVFEYMWDVLTSGRECFVGDGVLTNSDKFNSMAAEEAKWVITEAVGGQRKTQYRLRDWLISRQRYWGPPIPMIFCPACAEASAGKENAGWQAVPEKDLPVKLPYIKNFRPTGTDKSPLATVEKFYKVRCPKCRSWARRETDVSDTFLDSAWYYLGYLILGNQKSKIKNQKFAFDNALIERWLPVDMYIGGAEHAVLHLLYVRFLAMAFRDWGLTRFEEPFKKFRAHGLLIKDGTKMSKSRGNVVNPDDYIRAYGADALRMYLMFLGPFEQGGDFRDTGIRGITRFLERIWYFAHNRRGEALNSKPETLNKSQIPNPKSQISGGMERLVHKTIKKITDDIEGLQYNTAISALMVLLNSFEEKTEAVTKEHISIFLRLLAPFAPHITEELWHSALGGKASIHRSPWPQAEKRWLKAERPTLIIQINGRVRDRMEIEADVLEAKVKEMVLDRSKVRQWLGSRPVRKFIYVPGRIVNIVVEAK